MKYEDPKRPIKKQYYKPENYINILEKNNKNLNIPFNRPEVIEVPPWVNKTQRNEPIVKDIDHVKITLDVVGDFVKINLFMGIYELNEKYYTQYKTPSHKRIISAYREYGFSEEYINQLKKNILKTKQICDNFDMIKVFGVTKNSKQAKKPEPEPDDDESDQEMSDIDDDEPMDDDGGFDVDEMNDENEDDVDEDYFSDDA